MTSEPPLLSLVIPVKDEEQTVGPLAAEIERVLGEVPFPWEVVWVDDGSTDGTALRLAELPARHRLIQLDRNHGQSAAVVAGCRAARAAWIGTVDGDGQNDPADVVRLFEHACRYGTDMVNGIRTRRHDSLVRKVSSRIANGARNAVTGKTVIDVGCSTRVFRREVVAELPFFHGMHRFLPTLASMRGFTIAEVPVNHRPRIAGRSKYGINNRLWSGIRDLLGVRWLISRQRVWRARETVRLPLEARVEGASTAEHAVGPAARGRG